MGDVENMDDEVDYSAALEAIDAEIGTSSTPRKQRERRRAQARQSKATSRAAKSVGTRRTRSNATGRSEICQFRATPDLVKEFEALCERLGVSKADFGEAAFKAEIARRTRGDA